MSTVNRRLAGNSGIGRDVAQRYRVTFAKTAHMRYTSHLDVQRAWERLIRRAKLPLLFTQGFHPRPRMNLAAALPLGFTGRREIVEFFLVENLDPMDLLARLRDSAPPGIDVAEVALADSRSPAIQTQILTTTYLAELSDEVDLDALAREVSTLLAAETVLRERRGKSYDLRPLVSSITLDSDRRLLAMELASRPGATGRPDEVLRALTLDPHDAWVERTALILEATG